MTALDDWYDENAEHAHRRLEAVTERLERAIPEAVFVNGRLKSRDSFREKVIRKGYADPTTQVQDPAGVRVVVPRQHLVQDAQAAIRSVCARANWFVVQIEHRGAEAENLNVPGYQAVHVVLSLNTEDPSATVEVQIMTMLQNAWAVLQHDLVYKGSADPLHIRRVTTLAGLLELAEQEFENLRLAMSGGLERLPPVLTTPGDAETLATAVWPTGQLSASHNEKWAGALLAVVTSLDLIDRDRLLDVLGDADARAKIVTRIRAWRPWMNAYLVTDFLLRLNVPDYFARRAARQTPRDPESRAAFDAELAEFRRWGS